MKAIILFFYFASLGCASKPSCANSNDGFKAVFDPEKNCAVRIRQVVIGSDLDLPKSLSFKTAETKWSYRWVETTFHDGVLELGHFSLVPLENGDRSLGN